MICIRSMKQMLSHTASEKMRCPPCSQQFSPRTFERIIANIEVVVYCFHLTIDQCFMYFARRVSIDLALCCCKGFSILIYRNSNIFQTTLGRNKKINKNLSYLFTSYDVKKITPPAVYRRIE
jgi:hypothetical protein